MTRKMLDLIGHRYGRLVVTSEAERRIIATRFVRRFFNCRCDCGGVTVVSSNALRSNLTQSCGCLQRETREVVRVTHGATRHRQRSREYRIWGGIKSRCTNPKVERYPRYGGRGITICERWANSFEAFLQDVGPCPSDQHEIDRYPDNDGNYEPGNVRWATPEEQSWSRRGDQHYSKRKLAAVAIEP